MKPRLEKQRERAETVRPAVDQVSGAEKPIFLLVEPLPGQFIEQALPMAVDITHDKVVAVPIGRIGFEENHRRWGLCLMLRLVDDPSGRIPLQDIENLVPLHE